MANEISSNEDYIDVRDVIARFEELEGERSHLADATTDEDSTAEQIEDAQLALAEWTGNYGGEFTALRDLLEEMSGNGGDEQWRGDWYPVSLIRDSYFEQAMDELLEDIGDLPKNLPSYLTITVDYNALQMDYTSVEFEGVTYWYR